MLQDFDNAYGLKSIILRYFNAAGADPDNEIGEHHAPETHLIPLVLDAAAGKRPHIAIFGDDYETKDGTCIRDYIHVSDLADAHVRALKFLEKGGNSEAFNLSNGNGISVKNIIDVAKRVTGRNIPVRFGPRRHGDPAILLGDSTKAMNVLGWMPKYGDIEVILRHAWAWHEKVIGNNK
jgi:UDP-glucose 4-epimerase